MQIVINIDEELYEHIKHSSIVCSGMRSGKSFMTCAYNAIANGKPFITGHWIDKDEKSAVCSCCNRNNTLYGDFCKWCGAKMESEEQND